MSTHKILPFVVAGLVCLDLNIASTSLQSVLWMFASGATFTWFAVLWLTEMSANK